MQVVEVVVERDDIDPEGFRVWVDGRVGDDPVRFLLDTGATQCAVPQVGSTAGLPATGRNTGFGASGVSLGEDEVVVPDLTIGGLVLRDVPATRSASGASTAPLLGMNALGRYACEFRLADGVLVLHDRLPDRSDWRALLDRPFAQPMLPITVGGVAVDACWDTGASLSAFDVGFVDAHPELFTAVRATTGFDSAGVALDTAIAEVAGISVGNFEFAPSACAIVDLAPMNALLDDPLVAILGVPVMLLADWWFDFPGRRWYIVAR